MKFFWKGIFGALIRGGERCRGIRPPLKIHGGPLPDMCQEVCPYDPSFPSNKSPNMPCRAISPKKDVFSKVRKSISRLLPRQLPLQTAMSTLPQISVGGINLSEIKN